MGESLWAAFKEMEAFYNYDRQRAVFRRFFLSESLPRTIRSEVAHGQQPTVVFPEASWQQARGKYTRTYDQLRLGELSRELLEAQKNDYILIVTDQEISPPEEWRYIIWESWDNGGVVSLAPLDPEYWQIEDPNRVSTVKHRVRAACLAVVGRFLGLEACDNEKCFLYNPVDSVSRLDLMVSLGSEHKIPALENRGFLARARDPNKVQRIRPDPRPPFAWWENE